MAGLPAYESKLKELITFYLDDELFGINVSDVLEVNRDLIWTPIPGAASWILGAANLRGQIVTVLDIRPVLGYGERNDGLFNNVIIVSAKDELVGVLVDSIADVIDIQAESLQPAPKNLPGLQRRCVSAVVKQEETLIAILEIEAVLNYRKAPSDQ